MERRILIAFALCVLVLYAYQALLPRAAPPAEPAADESSQPSSAPSLPQREPVEPPLPAAEPRGEAPPAVVTETSERDVTLESKDVLAVFSNRGGVLKSWKLKLFLDEGGAPHDLVPQGIAADLPRPFSLRLDDPALSLRLNTALFKVETGTGAVGFEYEDASGLRARKMFRFEADHPYLLSAEVSVGVAGQPVTPVLQWGPAIGPLSTKEKGRYGQSPNAVLYVDGDLVRLDADDITKQSTYSGTIAFAGVDDQYFLTALVRPDGATLGYQPVTLPASVEGGSPNNLVSYEAQLATTASPQLVFVGPKDFDVLRAIDPDLVRAINFGWFAALVVPLLTSLKWINGFIGNYGWSIITLTLIINGLMFPLRHKSVVSMRKMQQIQPEVKAIQDRYAKLKATDPAKQKMNTELMALYRERGVNPASGCIPMLLIMPVLFAFYSLLSVAVELRGAPFVGWISDLSAPDPLYVTPVIMGATMVIQQRMAPTTMDPAQQKIMMIMPVVFTFMFLQAPSGLVIYWLVSNLWAIGQQHVTNRLIGPPPVHQVRPPGERRVKKAGAGRTEAADKREQQDKGESVEGDEAVGGGRG